MWQIERHHGDAAEFHQRALPDPLRPTLWWFEPAQPTLVLGSTQALDTIDHGACARAGVEVVRRRSGGAAVLLLPGEVVWADVLLPSTDPRWTADVGAAGHWLGEVWVQALHTLGVEDAVVHRGAMRHSRWSTQVCFAGAGPGEVFTSGGQKLIGVSQRRTRVGARFQCALHLRWQPELMASLFAAPQPNVAELAGAVATVAADAAAVAAAFEAALSI